MMPFLPVRGANFQQKPHTTKGAFAGNVSAAGARTGSFYTFAGWLALAAVGAFFGFWVFWGIVLDEVTR